MVIVSYMYCLTIVLNQSPILYNLLKKERKKVNSLQRSLKTNKCHLYNKHQFERNEVCIVNSKTPIFDIVKCVSAVSVLSRLFLLRSKLKKAQMNAYLF